VLTIEHGLVAAGVRLGQGGALFQGEARPDGHRARSALEARQPHRLGAQHVGELLHCPRIVARGATQGIDHVGVRPLHVREEGTYDGKKHGQAPR